MRVDMFQLSWVIWDWVQQHLRRNIAWDIGAEKVARLLADALDAALVLQPYSRLVIDCNRPPASVDFIPAVSDKIVVPGNGDIAQAERDARLGEIFEPFQAAVDELLGRRHVRSAFAIHSFTPRLAGGDHRPWHLGICCRKDLTTARRIVELVKAAATDLEVTLNEPYRIEDQSDWFVPRHCEPRGLAHSLIEIRNDLLLTDAGCERLAGIIAPALRRVAEEVA